ncbi:hypothetical protein LXL04_003720 [Taraxacum kok-saghyz]
MVKIKSKHHFTRITTRISDSPYHIPFHFSSVASIRSIASISSSPPLHCLDQLHHACTLHQIPFQMARKRMDFLCTLPRKVGGFRFQMFPLPLLISPRLKTPISSERVGSDFEWVPSSPRSPFNCNLREPLPSASSAAASACPFYFVNNNRIGNISSSFGSGGCVDAVSAAIETLENDPCTNAGRGSNLTEDVHVECDASVMDGKSGTFGAVGAVPEKLCNGDKWTSQAGAKWTKIHPQQQQPNKRESQHSSSTAAAQGQNGQKQPPRMSSKNRKEPNNSSNTAGPPSTQDRGRKAKNYLQKLPPFL